ncbi:MAG TPA: glycosyltransferase 87 family protein [Acidimicrobiia bacterium]|nr:glycosyltransferase 87 family protein [Acidimicrobiia bacterium]
MKLSNLRARWTEIARAEPTGRWLVNGALAVEAVVISVMLLMLSSITPAERALLLVVALVAWALLVALGWTRGTLPLWPVLAVIALTFFGAVLTPSYQSNDVYSYAMYGRIFTEHHRSPYSTYPMHYEGDPMRRHVAEMWQRTPDVYGLGFTGLAAGLAPLIGESTFLARFAYQLVAVAAVTAILVLLWKRTRSPVVLAFVGLHPMIAVSVVNGGHNDALMALGLLLGILLALERRVALAALAFAFAVSIKITALPAAIVLAVWALRRWRRRDVAVFSGIVLALGALPYLFLSGWLQTVHTQSRMISRQSFWMPAQDLFTHVLSLSGSQFGGIAAFVSMLALGALGFVILWRHTNGAPEVAVGAIIGAFFVASPWVMPWYAFAALPLLALRKPNLLTWAVAIDAALVLVGDQFPSLAPGGVGTVTHLILQMWMPLFAFGACVAVIVFRPREVLGTAPAPDAPAGLAATAAPVLAPSA